MLLKFEEMHQGIPGNSYSKTIYFVSILQSTYIVTIILNYAPDHTCICFTVVRKLTPIKILEIKRIIEYQNVIFHLGINFVQLCTLEIRINSIGSTKIISCLANRFFLCQFLKSEIISLQSYSISVCDVIHNR